MENWQTIFNVMIGIMTGSIITYTVLVRRILDLEDEIAMIKMAIEMHNKKHLECEGKKRNI